MSHSFFPLSLPPPSLPPSLLGRPALQQMKHLRLDQPQATQLEGVHLGEVGTAVLVLREGRKNVTLTCLFFIYYTGRWRRKRRRASTHRSTWRRLRSTPTSGTRLSLPPSLPPFLLLKSFSSHRPSIAFFDLLSSSRSALPPSLPPARASMSWTSSRTRGESDLEGKEGGREGGREGWSKGDQKKRWKDDERKRI